MSEKIYLKAYESYVEKQDLVTKIGTYIFVEATSNTSTGNWLVTSEEIAEDLDIDEDIIVSLKDDIVDELDANWSNQVESVDTYDDEGLLCFDVNLWCDYIPGFIQDDPAFCEEKEVD